jgi:hypothetical protein
MAVSSVSHNSTFENDFRAVIGMHIEEPAHWRTRLARLADKRLKPRRK